VVISSCSSFSALASPPVAGRAHLAHARKEAAQAVDGQQHQVVQAQAGQGFELLAGPARPSGMKRLRGLQHRIGIGLAADAPQQAFGLEPRAAAGGQGV
jgi:hypothetical protein